VSLATALLVGAPGCGSAAVGAASHDGGDNAPVRDANFLGWFPKLYKWYKSHAPDFGLDV